jgi:glycosyltransferase involved in cell wall biosynthesis
MNIVLSVITCSHNPRNDYLKQVVDALRAQTLDKRRWDYLLIDNMSYEPLAARVKLSWHPFARHLREEQLGLTHARLRAIQEAKGEVLVFVDDDNLLDADYLEQVTKIAESWPILGAFGGQVRPRFEQPPPEWTRQYWSRLVIREFDHDLWSNIPTAHEAMPSGAGLCVRRGVANRYLGYHKTGQRRLVLDRTGTSLLSGGDTDLATTACDLGLGVGLFTSLKLTHLIPPQRLEENYLTRLLEDLAFSGMVLNSFRPNDSPQRGIGAKTKTADLARMLLMNRRQRRFFRAVRHGERKAAQFLANN